MHTCATIESFQNLLKRIRTSATPESGGERVDFLVLSCSVVLQIVGRERLAQLQRGEAGRRLHVRLRLKGEETGPSIVPLGNA